MISIDISNAIVSWSYNGRFNQVNKQKIIDAKCFEQEDLLLIIYEEESNIYPCLEGYNLNGVKKFKFKSDDKMGISRFAKQSGIDIPIVGWIKEKDEYTDYYFSVNSQNGTLTQYGRAY
jgi:hypothetical protein